jgi:hypothetical protein
VNLDKTGGEGAEPVILCLERIDQPVLFRLGLRKAGKWNQDQDKKSQPPLKFP